jgi:quinol monooxygenase YgiN
MIIVHVHVQVRADDVEAFKVATSDNARHSLEEPGVVRFDVIQRLDQPTTFMLIEVYRTAEAMAAHKTTRHYQVWRDTVAGMMAVPRTSVQYVDVFPPEDAWTR